MQLEWDSGAGSYCCRGALAKATWSRRPSEGHLTVPSENRKPNGAGVPRLKHAEALLKPFPVGRFMDH